MAITSIIYLTLDSTGTVTASSTGTGIVTTNSGTVTAATTDWTWNVANAATTNVCAYTWKIGNDGYCWPNIGGRLLTPQDRLQEILRQRQAPYLLRGRTPLSGIIDARERRARETLGRVIGLEKLRRFLRDGFVTVRGGESGLTYQIFPGCGLTNVYRDGKRIERMCVVLEGNFPPTDSLIVRFLMLINDEKRFRSLAVKHSRGLEVTASVVPFVDQRPLTEIFRDLKGEKDVRLLSPVSA